MTSQLHDYLKCLYSPEQAQTTYTRLMERIQQAKHDLSNVDPNETLFSEQDVVLITYGDSLLREGDPPLKVLHQFTHDYLTGVVSTIHILPFYPYSSDDGFSVVDYYAVREELGTWADVEEMSADFSLMFDAVFNHMSAQSEWFRAFITGDSAFAGMFRTESPEADLSAVTRPRTSPLLTPFQKVTGETVYVWTTFSADQVDIDFSDPDTLLRMIDVLLFYVSKGAQVIRLDAIAFLWKVVGTSCIHLDETHWVIQLMRTVLDEVAPQVILITETNVPHRENISYFGDGSNEAQMVYNFTLPPLLFHTLLSGDATILQNWVNTLDTPSERTTFFNFTASHDGIGVRPVEGILSPDQLSALIAHTEARGGRVSYKNNPDGSQSPYELNITYVDALTDPTESEALQVQRFLVSQGIMLTLAGVPAIYIHSLLGSHNDIEGVQRLGYNRAVNREKLNVDTVKNALSNSTSFRAQVFDAYTNLVKIRRAQPAFHPNGKQQSVPTNSAAVFGLLRTAPDSSQRILALYNVTNQEQTFDMTLFGSGRDLIGGEQLLGEITLSPYGIYWLQLD